MDFFQLQVLQCFLGKKLAVWYFFRLYLVEYVRLPLLVVGIGGLVFAVVFAFYDKEIFDLKHRKVTSNTNNKTSSTDKKLLLKLYLRSLTIDAPLQYVNEYSSGFEYSILPFIDHYYKNGFEEKRQAFERYIFYNITQYIGTFCQGLVASMEKQAAEHEDYDVSSISAVKASLMGPMSGIGDTLFWGILRVIAAGIAMTFGMQGNVLAPIVFLLIYNIPAQWCSWEMTKLGFSVGSEHITEMYSSGLLNVFTKAARTLGLIMLGGMTSSLVQFKTKLIFHVGGGQVINIQNILDSLLKGLVPLLITLSCYWLIAKKHINFTIVIIGLIIFYIFLSALCINLKLITFNNVSNIKIYFFSLF
ncbi:PTS system mannose/fructose/sorbose family transporter subunit IID [Lactobacillus panisapium]|uniref:PTS system mannose/fructose/sorbose family transporter subunit IID n=1 Tax=Lactobacillus panisapium TaxID=2012495 RepID=UPI00215DC52E|nr:PTS system mannose/fructose/sorbose family transporter subunit IID [Lactobacillus panisapium]